MTDKNPKVATGARIEGVFQTDHATTGQNYQIWTPLRVDQNGILISQLVDSSGLSLFKTVADGYNNLLSALPTIPYNILFNGSTWDRQRANTEETLLASAARTATLNSADFTNYNAKGLHVVINVTAIAATPSIVPFIQGKDPISGTYYDILEGLPITTTGINIIKVYPGISAVVNVSASDLLPRTYRVRVEHGDADSITYSVAGALVL